MEPGGVHTDFLSPESTVTSLLSSSGHLRSGLTEHSAPYRYRDKDYDSASDALDAYIADFYRSCQGAQSSAGGLVLPRAPPSTPARPGLSALRNRDVLSERLTDRELDFLSLPVGSPHHHGNRDRLSMTTEELLSLPCDGSMPVTHTSALIQGLLSQSGLSQPWSSSRTGHRRDRVISSYTAPQLIHHDPHPTRTSSVLKPSVGVCQAADRAEGLRSSSLHLPHWFTSHREDLDCSELSSVPELKYPAWIRCDLSDPPVPQQEPEPRECALSCFSQPDEEDEDRDHIDVEENQQTVTDLMLQFAQHISAVSADRKQTSDITDHRIESLIRIADQVLHSLYKSSRGAEGLQEPSASPLGPVTQQHQQEASQSHRHMQDSRKQPGPVEALKQMLFRLQLVEAELHRQQQQPMLSLPHKPNQPAVTQRDEGEEELESSPGGGSLQRALSQLSRLKLLVEKPGDKLEEEEDEGRLSSSSATRSLCQERLVTTAPQNI